MEDLLPQGQGDKAARVGVAFQNRWDIASKGGSHRVCGGQPDRSLPRDVELPEQIAQHTIGNMPRGPAVLAAPRRERVELGWREGNEAVLSQSR